MKRLCLLYGMIFWLFGVASAQDGVNLGALKIAYITKRLNLSTEEAQRFWPIYNQYDEELRMTRQQAKKDGLPEIDIEERVLNVRKKYNYEFTKALSPEKVNTLFRSEKEFGNFVQREMQRRQLRIQQQQRRPMLR